MSYQRERDEFIATMAREGMPLETAQTVLRLGATLQRLAIAQCNGDWPYDNGQRADTALCAVCGTSWVRASMRKVKKPVAGLWCQDCRVGDHLKRVVLDLPGFGVVLNGDPRGYVALVTVPSGKTSDWGQRGIGVPTRG